MKIEVTETFVDAIIVGLRNCGIIKGDLHDATDKRYWDDVKYQIEFKLNNWLKNKKSSDSLFILKDGE